MSDYRAVQRKIDSALELIRQRNAEKERAKKEESDRLKQAELDKKAKPAPPKDEASFEESADKKADAAVIKQKPVEDKPASEMKKEETPKPEKKENVRTMTFDSTASLQTKTTPSFGPRNVYASAGNAEDSSD